MRQIVLKAKDNTSYISGFINEPSSDQFMSYFDMLLDEDAMKSFKQWLSFQPLQNFGIIKHIDVAKESKGKGIGKYLLQSFVLEAGCSVLLVCDNLEPQREGFDLEKWYVSQGFDYIGVSSRSGPVLILTR